MDDDRTQLEQDIELAFESWKVQLLIGFIVEIFDMFSALSLFIFSLIVCSAVTIAISHFFAEIQKTHSWISGIHAWL